MSDQLNKSYDTELESFKSLTGDSDADCLKAFVNQISSGVKDSLSPIVLSPSSDKSHRTVSFVFESIVLFIPIYLYMFLLGCILPSIRLCSSGSAQFFQGAFHIPCHRHRRWARHLIEMHSCVVQCRRE